MAIKIVSYNMGSHSGHIPTLDQVVLAVRATGKLPDVMLAQETPWQVKHGDLARELGFGYFISGRDNVLRSNRALFSRTPLTSPVSISMIGSVAGALCANTVIQGSAVQLCSVHLETIKHEMACGESVSDVKVILKYLKKEFFEENARSRSVDALLFRLSEMGADRVIIGGDFNTFPFSKAIRKMNAYFKDALRFSSAYIEGTYVDFPLPVKPRIDFIFHSPEMSARDGKVHKITSGDHVPISAFIVLE